VFLMALNRIAVLSALSPARFVATRPVFSYAYIHLSRGTEVFCSFLSSELKNKSSSSGSPKRVFNSRGFTHEL
jgi:hypothetical protein